MFAYLISLMTLALWPVLDADKANLLRCFAILLRKFDHLAHSITKPFNCSPVSSDSFRVLSIFFDILSNNLSKSFGVLFENLMKTLHLD